MRSKIKMKKYFKCKWMDDWVVMLEFSSLSKSLKRMPETNNDDTSQTIRMRAKP